MGKRNLVKILVWENVLTAVISIVSGLLLGILFSKLAELAALRILGGETGFTIRVEPQPIIVTAVLFLGIFLLIMLRMIFYIFRLRPVEMLKSENVGEKPPKASVLSGGGGHRSPVGDAHVLCCGCHGDHRYVSAFYLGICSTVQTAPEE